MTDSYQLDEPSTDASLLKKAIIGDAESWRQFVQLYGPIIYRWLRRAGMQSADAADTMQETLMAVSRRLASWRKRSGVGFRGWLWTIARSKYIDFYRRSSRRHDAGAIGGSTGLGLIESHDDQNNQDPSEGSDTPSGLSRWSQSDDPPSEPGQDRRFIQLKMIAILKQEIDPKTWKMFAQCVIDQRDPMDVAADFGVTKWTVYKARSRVLAKLRCRLDGLDE